MQRFTSRKFITTLAAQVAALLVLFWPQQQDTIMQAVQGVAALVVLGVSALGYVSAEASIDRANKEDAEP